MLQHGPASWRRRVFGLVAIREAIKLDKKSRLTYVIAPFPRNVYPQNDVEMELGHTKAVLKKMVGMVTFFEAVQYGHFGIFMVMAASEKGELLCAACNGRRGRAGGGWVVVQDSTRPYIYTYSL